MTQQQLYNQASNEWHQCNEVRQRYPTFVYYWRERYERVYNFQMFSKQEILREILPH